MDHQRSAVRAELHGIVDRVVDDWPWIDSLSGHVRAVSGGDGGTSSKGDHADPTLAAAMAGDAARGWLDAFRDLRVRLRVLDAGRAKMAPAKARRGRENTVEICTLCSLPAPKVRRVDGLPYCATSCFYRVWRTKERTA